MLAPISVNSYSTRGGTSGKYALEGNPAEHPFEQAIDSGRDLAADIDVRDRWRHSPALHSDAARGVPDLRRKTQVRTAPSRVVLPVPACPKDIATVLEMSTQAAE